MANRPGIFQVGLAPAADPRLSRELKLPLLRNVSREKAIEYAGKWAWKIGKALGEAARELTAACAMATIAEGLVRTIKGVPDGDWIFVDIPDPSVIESPPEKCADAQVLRSAFNIMVATKVNWWKLRHHTGQKFGEGYVKQLLETMYPGKVTLNLVTAVYNAGHRCSTLNLLRLAKIPGIVPVDDPIYEPVANIPIEPDVLQMFESFPAGTRRVDIAYEAVKELVASPLAKFCSNIREFCAIPEVHARVSKARASHHIDGRYLTGVPRAKYDDSEMNVYLGRLGTFMKVLFPHSSCANSPHLTWGRIQSYIDFDPIFELALKQLKNAPEMTEIADSVLKEKGIAELKASLELDYTPEVSPSMKRKAEEETEESSHKLKK